MNQRQSAINLIPAIYMFMSSNSKKLLIGFITKFATEDTPLVKRELATNLKDLSLFIDEEIYLGVIDMLIKDSNDTVRLPLMDAVVALKTHPSLSKVAMQKFIETTITRLALDESWRVRLTVADKIHEVLFFPVLSPGVKQTVVETFAKLLDDKEAETRNVCCMKLESIAERIGKEDIMDNILIELKKIEKDSVSYVRGALAGSLLRICPLIGKNKTNDFVFPVFLNLIKDESHDIRMTLIKTLDRLHEVINIDIFVQSIIPSLLEIANNKSWRIRIQITESIPVMARILSRSLFMENILGFCIAWLNDSVYAIREAACKLMKKLYDIYKGEEFEKKLIEKLNEMRCSNSYLIRNTVLILAKEFVHDEFDNDFLERKLYPLVIKSSKDKISNVRMNAAVVLKKLLKIVRSREVLREVQSCCEELKRDIDVDVQNALIDN
jgi:serine/threonine-protein phosphatase 2A regulatory subunit A